MRLVQCGVGRRRLYRTQGRGAAAILFVLVQFGAFSLGVQPLTAQSVDPAGAFATDPDAPIEIEADRLEVEQNKQTATFVGNVLAVQGAVRLRSDRLKVTYARGGAGQTGGGTQITEINATGQVHVTGDNDQSADGEWAIYDVGPRQITMGDAVVLRQGPNVIRGKKLKIDLNTGMSRVDGAPPAAGAESGGDGRVKGLFLPSSE